MQTFPLAPEYQFIYGLGSHHTTPSGMPPVLLQQAPRQTREDQELREGPNQQRQVARPQLITHTYCGAGKQINVIDDLFPNLL